MSSTNKYSPLPLPAEIEQAIVKAEAVRLGMTEEEMHGTIEYAAYFPDYMTGSPGYVGPLVVVVWSVSPDAVSTFYAPDGRWQHCNSSHW